VPDLMAALRASVEQARANRGKAKRATRRKRKTA
jgi:non-homologous end joining protein Ku